MSQSLCSILVHIIFSTKEREEFISQEIEGELYRYIRTILNDLKCPLIAINGMKDHIHLLVNLNKNVIPSQILQEIKSHSSRWIKTRGTNYSMFSWQGGYAMFSVSRRNADSLIEYINNQKEHHKKVSFKDELLKLIKRSGIEYNEKYLWD